MSDAEQVAKPSNPIQAFELAVANSEVAGTDRGILLNQAREYLARSIEEACEFPADPERPLADLIESAATAPKGRRDSAILVLRACAVPDLFEFDQGHLLDRRIIALVETGFADQLRTLKLPEKRQTYEKMAALSGFHESMCHYLRLLSEVRPSLSDINSVEPDVQKALRHGPLNAYLQPFGWNVLKAAIDQLSQQVTELHECQDSTYKVRFDRLTKTNRDARSLIDHHPSFLTRIYLRPFIEAIEGALRSLQEGASGRFSCDILPRRKGPSLAEKRYPLHLVDKLVTVTIPCSNSGPGVAADVTVEIDHGEKQNVIALESAELRLGDIPPGDFAISFRLMVVSPAAFVDLAMQISWNQLFGTPKSIAFDVRLAGQDTRVDWTSLEQQDPYSLEVAEGDRFVGRTAKVQGIGNRLLKAQMSSTYITGQKRIGKTSLAQAVLRYVKNNAKHPIEYETLYLEWGEYCCPEATATVRALGEQIQGFLKTFVPRDFATGVPSIDGSLAPINVTAKTLERYCPNKRFVIVLDEFDEIHPEMYRYGPLAEAFFANIRTLAARKNLAFILVGGERMPFIIGAQGDQLNKFVREPLDYFSRSDEWPDYVELVTGPVRNSLNWEESSLTELFNLTSGHPYYTKLLCAKVFANAVLERDTEIIPGDVRHALVRRLAELDTNAFAHFWKDGINAEREEAEVIELKRLRVLVAFGRALRERRTDRETIERKLSGGRVHQSEVGPVLDDFCRRDVMRDLGGRYSMHVPIFERWIQDIGVSKLISSTLADDLETELQKANEEAFVKAGEITEVVNNWPLYRGNRVGAEEVRAWLDHVPNTQEQRLLFCILRHLRFVSTPQIAEWLREAHEKIVARATPPLRRETKVEKRRDLLVTYLDGPGKSGATYARAYAKENGLLMECVLEPARLLRVLNGSADLPSGIVVVDDLAGTGGSISESVVEFLTPMHETLASKQVPIFLIVLLSTAEAEKRIRLALSRYDNVRWQLHIANVVGDESRAFPSNGHGFWKDTDERDRAKALCIRIGTGLFKDPLGYGSQSLLIAFPETCPNNNLPIIFASRAGQAPWTPLLPRSVS